MKVLIVSTYDIQGGAAKGALRLHQLYLKYGIDSSLFVQKRVLDSDKIFSSTKLLYTYFFPILSFLDRFGLLFYPNRKRAIFSNNGVGYGNINELIELVQPDVIHLHWINNSFFNLKYLTKVKIPIFWTLHDRWPLTGGCHVNVCDNFLKECGSCPQLGSRQKYDLSYINFKSKSRIYKKIRDRLTIIAPSKWMQIEVERSALMRGICVKKIHNPLDYNLYYPFRKDIAREVLGIKDDKKIVLYGAMNVINDKNKGFEFFKGVMNDLDEDIQIVVFGTNKEFSSQEFKQSIKSVGILRDEISLRLLYSASDVVVVPSLEENLSYTVIEALTCGCPVVAFDVGGNSELIEHEFNGYLVKPFSIPDMANGIDWVISNSNQRMRRRCRDLVVNKFNEKELFDSFIRLYRSAI